MIGETEWRKTSQDEDGEKRREAGEPTSFKDQGQQIGVKWQKQRR